MSPREAVSKFRSVYRSNYSVNTSPPLQNLCIGIPSRPNRNEQQESRRQTCFWAWIIEGDFLVSLPPFCIVICKTLPRFPRGPKWQPPKSAGKLILEFLAFSFLVLSFFFLKKSCLHFSVVFHMKTFQNFKTH